MRERKKNDEEENEEKKIYENFKKWFLSKYLLVAIFRDYTVKYSKSYEVN